MPPLISGWAKGEHFRFNPRQPKAATRTDAEGSPAEGTAWPPGRPALAALLAALRSVQLPSSPAARTVLLAAVAAIVLGGTLAGSLTALTLSTNDGAVEVTEPIDDGEAPSLALGDSLGDPSSTENGAQAPAGDGAGDSTSSPAPADTVSQGDPSSDEPVSGLSGVAAPAPSITVSSATVGVGETVDITVSLSGISQGMSGFDIVLTEADRDIAEIINVSFGTFGLSDTRLLAFNQLRLRAVDLREIFQSDTSSMQLLTLTIRGRQPGSSMVSVTVNAIDDDLGDAVTPLTYDGEIVVQ